MDFDLGYDAFLFYLTYITIVWIGLMLSALIINFFQFYKKAFLDHVYFRKYRRFWFRVATLWCLVGAVFLAHSGQIHDGRFHLIYFVQYVITFIVMLSIPYLILLLVSLGPAKWQNWYGKSK